MGMAGKGWGWQLRDYYHGQGMGIVCEEWLLWVRDRLSNQQSMQRNLSFIKTLQLKMYLGKNSS